jgi:glucosamine-6-phosphate deaminase
VTVRLFDTPDEIGRHAASYLLARLRAAHAPQRDCLVGCPTGRAPRPVLAALVTVSVGFDAEGPASIVRAAGSHEIFADHAACGGRG